MTIPRTSDWARWCADMADAWSYLAEHGPEMIRLAKMPSAERDGFGSGAGEQRVSGSSSEDTQTEAAAMGRADDWLEDRLFELFGSVASAQGWTRKACKAVRLVMGRMDMRTAQTTPGGYCNACDAIVSGDFGDRLRAGYCAACYASWLRWKEGRSDPDHLAFQRFRRANLRPAMSERTG